MKANKQSDRVVLRDGKVTVEPGADCCCCPCSPSVNFWDVDQNLAGTCGIDYIAVELELCYVACRKYDRDAPPWWDVYPFPLDPPPAPERSCPEDKWTTTLEFRSEYGFRVLGSLDSNAPPGENQFLALNPDGGYIDPDNPIEFPPYGFSIIGHLGCSGGRYRILLGFSVNRFGNCFSSFTSLCPDPYPWPGFTPIDYNQDYTALFGTKQTELGCCPHEPSGALSVEYAFPCEGGGEVFKVTGLTIVYL